MGCWIVGCVGFFCCCFKPEMKVAVLAQIAMPVMC